jgi:hypothetical protein
MWAGEANKIARPEMVQKLPKQSFKIARAGIKYHPIAKIALV